MDRQVKVWTDDGGLMDGQADGQMAAGACLENAGRGPCAECFSHSGWDLEGDAHWGEGPLF